jgi:hypothetical protein
MKPIMRPALTMSAVVRAPHPQRAWCQKIARALARRGLAMAASQRRAMRQCKTSTIARWPTSGWGAARSNPPYSWDVTRS